MSAYHAARDPSEFNLPDKIKHYQTHGDPETAAELLKELKPMVMMAARKISRNRPDLVEDLFQVGQISLLRSVRQYDPGIGTPFEGYALKSLIGHMKNYLRDKSWYIQVPRRIKEKGAQIQKAIDELTLKLQRSPNVPEIAGYMSLSEEETMEVLAGKDFYQLASLDVPVAGQEGKAELIDLISAKTNDYHRMDIRMDLEKAFERLNDMERQVLQYLYYEGLSQREAASQIGVSQMSVSRIQRRAIRKLKSVMVTDG